MGKIFTALEKSKQILPGSFTGLEEKPMVNAVEESPMVNGVQQSEGMEPPGELDANLITHLTPHSFEAEQFRILKTTILFPHKGIPPRTIMVTSTSPGEGKSFVASNIAISIAKSIDEHVLLMDCDLRLPSLHKRFGFTDIPGLSEYLRGKISLGSILKKTPINKLSLLPAGKPPANPSELISSEQMRRLIHEVKNRYEDRYIIIDSPPPYLTAEANALARQVDGIVIVVKTGKTKRADVQDLIDTYGREKILGVVKNFQSVNRDLKNINTSNVRFAG